MDDVQGDGVDHVLNNHSQHSVRPASLLQKNGFIFGDLAARRQEVRIIFDSSGFSDSAARRQQLRIIFYRFVFLGSAN
jgi:hypothetical protein